jgi:hypothetical protein
MFIRGSHFLFFAHAACSIRNRRSPQIGLVIVGDTEGVRDHRRIDEATRPREPSTGASSDADGIGGDIGDMRDSGVRRFERRQPHGSRRSRGGRHFGSHWNPRGFIRELVETAPVPVQHSFQDGFRRWRIIRRDNPQAPAVPVFDGGLVLEQQREHGGVLAFRVGERRTAAFESRQRPAGVDRVAGRAGEVIERRLDGIRQRVRWLQVWALKHQTERDSPNAGALFALTSASIYGGLFGAGLGILLTAMLAIFTAGELRAIKALKNLLATSVSVAATALFIVRGMVAWQQTVVMLTGALAGGYAGGLLIRTMPAGVVHSIVIVAGALMTIIYAYRYWF